MNRVEYQNSRFHYFFFYLNKLKINHKYLDITEIVTGLIEFIYKNILIYDLMIYMIYMIYMIQVSVYKSHNSVSHLVH